MLFVKGVGLKFGILVLRVSTWVCAPSQPLPNSATGPTPLLDHPGTLHTHALCRGYCTRMYAPAGPPPFPQPVLSRLEATRWVLFPAYPPPSGAVGGLGQAPAGPATKAASAAAWRGHGHHGGVPPVRGTAAGGGQHRHHRRVCGAAPRGSPPGPRPGSFVPPAIPCSAGFASHMGEWWLKLIYWTS